VFLISHSRYRLKGYTQPEDAWSCYKNISKHNKVDNKLNKTKLININFFFFLYTRNWCSDSFNLYKILAAYIFSNEFSFQMFKPESSYKEQYVKNHTQDYILFHVHKLKNWM